jgi:predicted lipoprotein
MVLGACGGGGVSRADVVGGLTNEAVPARWANLASEAEAVSAGVASWCLGGDGGDASAATATLRDRWLELSPFWFGPVMSRRSRFVVDPAIVADDIDALAAGTQPVDAASLADLAGADQRGLGAIEHLTASAPDDRRCEYATGLAELIGLELAALAADWVEYGPSLAAGDAAANMALQDMVSETLFAVRTLKERPDAVGNDALAAGIRWMLLGGDGGDGIAPLLPDDTVERLASEFDAGLPNEYERTIATDVVGALGIAVNFSDADGDS